MDCKTLIVLGSPNSQDGDLGVIAVDRLRYVVKYYKKCNNIYIMCTGGFGKHFNTTTIPHAEYAKRFLLLNGINKDCFLESAYSSNTVDDALKVKEILLKHQLNNIVVVTSLFHLDRVRIIFNELLNDFSKHYIGISHRSMPPGVLKELIAHELAAIKAITENGIYY